MTDSPFVFLPLGAIIQSFKVAGIDIVLRFPTQDQYVKHNTAFFGETIGRVANRIKGARINSLNGQSYSLAVNDEPNSLHGGNVGWGKRIWNCKSPVGVKQLPGVEESGESVTYTLVSEDGDEGYPGTVEATVTYTTNRQEIDGKEVNEVTIEYEAELKSGAEETVINLTNHSYFNLSGDPTISGTIVTLGTRNHLPLDDTSVPIGHCITHPSINTTKPVTLSAVEPVINGCFTLSADTSAVPIDTRSQPLGLNLSAHHAKTGIHLEVFSTEPSFQFYTGDFIDIPAVMGAPARGKRSGFCCEPGRYVNACNVPEWRNMTVLKKGDIYGARIVYRAWSD